MKNEKTIGPSQQKPIRLWPGVIAALLLILVKYIIPTFIPDTLPVAMLGGLIFGLIIIVWWGFFSRVPRLERWFAVGMMIIALIAVRPFLDESIANAGMGLLFPILALPILSLAFVAWAVISRCFSKNLRRVTMIITIFLAVGAWTLVQTGGINNDGDSDFSWRWVETPEDQLLAQTDEALTAPLSISLADTIAAWPGFRGADRDGILHGVRIETDWSASPPIEIWRRPIGPGWSSFAVLGNIFFTQEQRGEDELVSCYSMNTGKSIWTHRDKVRFWESNAGAGPRATPTISGNRVYAFGATGILNVLDAADGRIIWSRDVATDTETKVPMWGFSSSPLVLDDMVIIAAAGSLIAYDLSTGDSRWSIPAGGDCYSSPHLLNIGGVAQILLQNENGTISVSPADGAVLWDHPWSGNPIVQPVMTENGDILISVDDRSGVRRITVTQNVDGWTTEEQWTSNRVKPYFNDSVIHNGHLYGFHGRSLACIDVNDGTRKWKGGRYGRGQFILLADQDLLLVLSEKGELALVNADPDQFIELARFPAIEGKTWNHPVLVGDVLLVRNAQEMAAFRLSLAGI